MSEQEQFPSHMVMLTDYKDSKVLFAKLLRRAVDGNYHLEDERHHAKEIQLQQMFLWLSAVDIFKHNTMPRDSFLGSHLQDYISQLKAVLRVCFENKIRSEQWKRICSFRHLNNATFQEKGTYPSSRNEI